MLDSDDAQAILLTEQARRASLSVRRLSLSAHSLTVSKSVSTYTP